MRTLRDWYATTWGPAVLGAVLYWAALPPVDGWPLAWLAPVPWMSLIRRPALAGRHPWRSLYLVHFAFWMAALHWLRLPYWATAFGWVALSAYLAVYLPIWIALSRIAVGRLRVPLVLAAPALWMGLELARAHLLTGFQMAALAHTQWRWTTLIQISDLGGGYLVDGLIVMIAAGIASLLSPGGAGQATTPSHFFARRLLPLVVGLAMLGLSLAYGQRRLGEEAFQSGPRVALIQGSVDTELKEDPNRRGEVFEHYFALSQDAARRFPQADVMVWPETVFRDPMVTSDSDAQIPSGWTCNQDEFREGLAAAANHTRQLLASTARRLAMPLVLGLDRHHFGPQRIHMFNAAAWLDREGQLLGYYDKNHPVMFGEYIPFARFFPWVYRLSPLAGGLDEGAGPAAFRIGAWQLCPSICYETVLSHVIRRQIRRLRDQGEEPDVLVNLTNDGWFWGSSELDLHLVCGIFRAVECRKPLVIAANTGFSAHIDGSGRLLQRGPRRATAVLLAEVQTDARKSPYLQYGDLPAGAALLFALVAAAIGLWGRFFR